MFSRLFPKGPNRKERRRLMALDYVTATGMVPPQDWCRMASNVERYLSSGEFEKEPGTIHEFPRVINVE